MRPLTESSALPWPPLQGGLKLEAGEVRVLCARLDLSPQRLRQLAGTLSPDELDRAARFYVHGDQDRFIARRGLLRELLGSQVQIEPSRLQFSAGPFGKLALMTVSGERPLHFSLAHSGAMAVLALSRDGEIGVDIERVRDLTDLPALVSTVCSAREQLEWQTLPGHERGQAFFNLWTRKEAYLKGTGQGLSKPPREIEVPLRQCGPDQALTVLDRGREVPKWSLRSLSTGDFALALAVSHSPARVCCRALGGI